MHSAGGDRFVELSPKLLGCEEREMTILSRACFAACSTIVRCWRPDWMAKTKPYVCARVVFSTPCRCPGCVFNPTSVPGLFSSPRRCPGCVFNPRLVPGFCFQPYVGARVVFQPYVGARVVFSTLRRCPGCFSTLRRCPGCVFNPTSCFSTPRWCLMFGVFNPTFMRGVVCFQAHSNAWCCVFSSPQ